MAAVQVPYQTVSASMNPYAIIHQTQALRVSDGMTRALLENCESAPRTLVLVWSQLGDFDTLEFWAIGKLTSLILPI